MIEGLKVQESFVVGDFSCGKDSFGKGLAVEYFMVKSLAFHNLNATQVMLKIFVIY